MGAGNFILRTYVLGANASLQPAFVPGNGTRLMIAAGDLTVDHSGQSVHGLMEHITLSTKQTAHQLTSTLIPRGRLVMSS